MKTRWLPSVQASFQHVIARTRLTVLILAATAAYFLVAALFAGLYLLNDGVVSGVDESKSMEWYDYFYFSAITQSTMEFGEYAPRNALVSRMLVASHVFIGIILFALISSIIIYRFLRPMEISIVFDPFVVFVPESGELRIRLYNQFKSTITRASAELYLRIWYDDLGTAGRFRSFDVPARRSTLPRLANRHTWIISTLPSESESPDVSWKSNSVGAQMRFHPAMVGDATQFIVFVSGETTDHQSTISCSYSYGADSIVCGSFVGDGSTPSMSDAEAIRRRARIWGKHIATPSSACATCRFTDSCRLPSRIQATISNTAKHQ